MTGLSNQWPVQPKTFTDAAGQTQTVTGIEANLSGAIIFDQKVEKNYPLYIRFVKENGSTYQEIFTSTEQAISGLVANQSMDAQVAKDLIMGIVKELAFPTSEQNLLDKASAFASLYGYTLL